MLIFSEGGQNIIFCTNVLIAAYARPHEIFRSIEREFGFVVRPEVRRGLRRMRNISGNCKRV